MKIGLFFLLNALILLHSCQPAGVKQDFIVLQPGYFCQLEAVTLVGDTVIIAGSYIPEENPNLTVQPVYSFLAAVGLDREVYWEQTPDEADYVRWQFLVRDTASTLYVIGLQESPVNGSSVMIFEVNTSNGKTTKFYDYPERSRISIESAIGLGTGNLKLVRRRQIVDNDCLIIQNVAKDKQGRDNMTCNKASHHLSKALHYPLDYIIAYGNGQVTDSLYVQSSYPSPGPSIILPSDFNNALVNDILLDTTNAFKDIIISNHLFFDTVPLKMPPTYLSSTTKNAQGPCLWRSGTDSTWQHTCLEYWPLHGSAMLRQMDGYTLMAFNAADTAKASAAYLVLFDEDLQPVWQQEIGGTEDFVIHDVVIGKEYIIVAGTLDTQGEGSSMAVKIVPLPVLPQQKIL